MVMGTSPVARFVADLSPKLQRQLIFRLQIELARANPTFFWAIDPTDIAIVATIPINSSFGKEKLDTKLNELDSLTVILQNTLILWAEDHGYEDTKGYEDFERKLGRAR